MSLPINPPAQPYELVANLEREGVVFDSDQIGKTTRFSYFYWTYADRAWAAGPYERRTAAVAARRRYLKLYRGHALRTWEV